MKSSKDILPVLVLEKTCRELYAAGMNIYQIADLFKLNTNEVRRIADVKPGKEYPKNVNQALIDEILYDIDQPVATDVIIRSEHNRFKKYSEIEEKCLDIMSSLLSYYANVAPGDYKTDSFKAQLAASFIKSTQQCRDELLKKYAIDKEAESVKDSNKVVVEFIENANVEDV